MTPQLESLLPNGQAWQRTEAQVAGLPVVVMQRTRSANLAPIRLYIEGDGNAYTAQGLPSANPTPHSPVGLQLALADDTGAALYYIGRPCQWVPLPHTACTPEVWTKNRFRKDVLEGYQTLIESLSAGRPTELVGFSGGAYIALQVGQALPNVTGIRTVAGNLDPNRINAHHRVPALEVGELPAIHLTSVVAVWGSKDQVIPPELGLTILEARLCKGSRIAQNVSHTKGWVEVWPKFLLQTINPCSAPFTPPAVE